MTADAERDRFIALLDSAAEKGRTINFWWRDDDAVAVTPQLDVLASIRKRYGVPLALAVIPERAEPDLAKFVAASSDLSVFQHGMSHRNHADKPRGERAGEFPHSRPMDDSLAALATGYQRMSALFGECFVPVLTPPWNRICAKVRRARQDAGLIGLSAYGRLTMPDPHQVNAHVDILRWRGGAHFAGRLKCYRSLIAQTRLRLSGLDQPVGLLTHHLVHDRQANAFMEEILDFLARHDAVRWPDARALFRIETPP